MPLTLKNFNKTTPPYKTYTIVWNEVSDPSQFFVRYEDDAAGLTQGSTKFDEFFGYYGCRLNSDGEETATVQQSSPGTLDITQLGTLTSGDNVMIAFPRRGIKMSKSGTQVTLSITEDPNKDGYQYYAHTKGSDIKDTLYLGTYKIVNKYQSLSGATPQVNYKRSDFRSWLQSMYYSQMTRYTQITIYARRLINAYYMLKYGNPNSQSVVGMGYVSGSATTNTGGTNSQTSATYGTSSSTQQVKLFGLEDWWGNIYEYLECCWFNNNLLTVDNTNSTFQDSAYSSNLGTSSSGWLAGISGSNDGMFMNINTSGGSGTTYYTDTSYNSSAGLLSAGASWSYGGDEAGAFHILAMGSNSSSSVVGSRLMYL